MTVTHGLSAKFSREYQNWKDMRRRCRNPNRRDFKHYGGRGIGICERWNDFAIYLADIKELGERPAGTSLDRIDNNKGYEPGNVCWATHIEQVRNRRVTIKFVVDGVEFTLAELAVRAGMSYDSFHNRVTRLGWSIEQALKTKPMN